MNKTSHTDEAFEGDAGYDQSPNPNFSDLTTNADFNGLVNSRTSLNDGSRALPDAAANMSGQIANDAPTETPGGSKAKLGLAHRSIDHGQPSGGLPSAPANPPAPAGSADNGTPIQRLKEMLIKVGSFIGPGFMISVAYIDPGNYSTDIAAGASYRFRLSGVFAEMVELYFIPLVAGCAISILDVMVLLIFYRPEGSMKGLRYFEIFIMCLVLGVVVCFCIQLSLIKDTTPGEVFQGYLPSKYLIESEAIYQACGILGATVMPHSLYLGSGIVQPRLREYDELSALLPRQVASEPSIVDDSIDKGYYVPSEKAIKHSLKLSILDLAISLFTFALFVNSAILIVAGAALYNNPNARDADIFGIHDLLSKSISPAAGTIFALALLLSGVSAGIVCTIAGQMVSEGALNWNIKPWLRRLVTRSISITPSIIIAGAVGREGLNAALNGSQVALSIILPFVTAPLIYFTCRDKYMTVQTGSAPWRSFSDVHILSLLRP
uniref:Manganese transporter n=1 Tax=Fusarium oxysporum (strain Fo5176) TaxID=660025 RepID=A0A0D2XLC3_FUSOF